MGFVCFLALSCKKETGTVTPQYTITTLAGSDTGYADGQGTAAKFGYLRGICVDKNGNLFVSDYYNNRIRKITPTGLVTTFAGSGVPVLYPGGMPAYRDGSAGSANFNNPLGIAVDDNGNVIVADCADGAIRKITPFGEVSTIGLIGFTNPINYYFSPYDVTVMANGNKALSARDVLLIISDSNKELFNSGSPRILQVVNAVTSDLNNNIYFWGKSVADSSNIFYPAIYKITPSMQISRFAGSGVPGHKDGAGVGAEFGEIDGMACDKNGNIYVAEGNAGIYDDGAIRKVDPTGFVSTIIRNDTTLGYPYGIAVDAAGTIYTTSYLRGLSRVLKIRLNP